MTKRIFRAIWMVALAVLLASLIFISGMLFSYFSNVQKNQLKIEAGLAAQGVSSGGTDFFEGFKAKNYRITWIGTDGTVLYDNKADSNAMENHLEREEVKEAFETGFGYSVRSSSTMMKKFLYAAQQLPDGSVIRVSTEQYTIVSLLLGMAQPIFIVALIALALSMFLASRLSKAIIKPLNELDLDDPLSNDDYDELSHLLQRIDLQQRQLKIQAVKLKQKQEEFEAVTGSMNEGLVLLNSRGTILSINKRAADLLNTTTACKGQYILAVNENADIHELIEWAQSGTQAEKIISLQGKNYQVNASPVMSEGSISGAALLFIDVTEKESIEQMRREFTANVSHELKTPLHTISGCAEILSSGIVKPEDAAQFTQQIYTEAQRMIHLVEDIIKLSHLDEGAGDMEWEDTELYSLAEGIVNSLAQEAKQSNVELRLTGERCSLNAIPQLIGGIIFNLCDNAIKYNRPGGSVDIELKDEGERILLNVSDTGIGISPEHKDRIFERFYRVDKSHSKELGGTGLGLSIVKHAAIIHKAEIKLDSSPGEGTAISVFFPKN